MKNVISRYNSIETAFTVCAFCLGFYFSRMNKNKTIKAKLSAKENFKAKFRSKRSLQTLWNSESKTKAVDDALE